MIVCPHSLSSKPGTQRRRTSLKNRARFGPTTPTRWRADLAAYSAAQFIGIGVDWDMISHVTLPFVHASLRRTVCFAAASNLTTEYKVAAANVAMGDVQVVPRLTVAHVVLVDVWADSTPGWHQARARRPARGRIVRVSQQREQLRRVSRYGEQAAEQDDQAIVAVCLLGGFITYLKNRYASNARSANRTCPSGSSDGFAWRYRFQELLGLGLSSGKCA